ncbi:MAG: hypothetical protein ACOYB4_11205, partial [Methyloceanibacter sp.]
MDALPQARRGYARDHRPDCKQLVLALVVTPEGFPLTCEIFPGNRLVRTTLEHLLDTIEAKFGKARRLWVFDRGIVSQDNLELLGQRGAHGRGGTPKSQLKACEQKLKSEVKVRPIWHWTERRVEAHVLVAFLGYCLWVCLKKKAQRRAPSLPPPGRSWISWGAARWWRWG